MNFETEIISTKNYLLRKVVSKVLFIIAIFSLILVIDRKLEGGLLELVNAPLYLYFIVWSWIIIVISFSVYLSTLKYRIGKLNLTSEGIHIVISLGNSDKLFPYTQIESVTVVLNNNATRAKYSRSILHGGRNWIEFTYQNKSYKYEFFMISIKKDEELENGLLELPTYIDCNKLIIKRRS